MSNALSSKLPTSTPAPEAGDVIEAALTWADERYKDDYKLRVITSAGVMHEGWPAGPTNGVLLLSRSENDMQPVFVRVEDCVSAQPISGKTGFGDA